MRASWRVVALIWMGLLALSACAPEPAQVEQPAAAQLPTRVPTVTPPYYVLDDAERTVRLFFDAWQREDWAAMYGLISAASQQATPYESFVSFYAGSHAEMRLQTLQTRLIAGGRVGNRVTNFTYDLTLQTGVVGTIEDTGRSIDLVLDDAAQGWRVAWSPGLIFAEMGSGAQLRLESFPPLRANIYDRDREIIADMNGTMVEVAVIPSQIPDRPACVSVLAQVLAADAGVIEAQLDAAPPDWRTDLGLIEPDAYRTYEAALNRDCAAQYDSRATRRYINGDLFAHVLGTVGFANPADLPDLSAVGFPVDSIIGQSGIEASWDETLRGTPGARLSLVRADGLSLRVLAEVSPEPAHEVVLTIDRDLQRAALDAIVAAYVDNADGWAATSEGAAAVVLDGRTGELLALVSYPTYNANAFTPYPAIGREQADRIIRQVSEDPREPQLNRATQGRYPAGSTMKTFTAIAALDSGEYSFDERYTSIGTWNRDIQRRDWLPGGHGTLNLSQALTHSCNSCFYEVGYRLNNRDPEILPAYLQRMGFGEDPGLQDLVTTPGLIGTPDTKSQFFIEPWSFSDAVDMAIGQGMVEVTPLQMALAYAEVATGVRYRPQMVLEASLLGDVSYEMTPEVLDTLTVDEDILPYLRSGLCNVTTQRYGTANSVFADSPLMDTVGVCGKTGTAENPPRPNPHAWFAAWAPAENPEIIVVVLVENAGDGSAVAAPIAREILEFYYADLLPGA